MGLTIHYKLKTSGTDAKAKKLITDLHQAAQDLPFKELGEIIDYEGDECKFDRYQRQDPLRWLLCQAEQSIEIKSKARKSGSGTMRYYMSVPPTRVIAFEAWAGEGCEASNFGLCKYPAFIYTGEGRISTHLSGWNWRSFCKTQYASNPDCGGVPHFLQCHLTVIALLDRAKQLKCLEYVGDEGHFWEKRDVQALVREIGSWNEMIAAFGGKLKDMLGQGVQSEINQFPNFEQLEMAGQNQLPAGYEKLAQLIKQVSLKS